MIALHTNAGWRRGLAPIGIYLNRDEALSAARGIVRAWGPSIQSEDQRIADNFTMALTIEAPETQTVEVELTHIA